jgi:hypothetical protein
MATIKKKTKNNPADPTSAVIAPTEILDESAGEPDLRPSITNCCGDDYYLVSTWQWCYKLGCRHSENPCSICGNSI